MNGYKYVLKNFQKGFKERSDSLKKRIHDWRGQPTTVRIEGPTNIARARSVGFKAKQGFIMVRVKVKKGKHVRRAPAQGRKPGRNRKTQSSGMGLKRIAEVKAGLKFINFKPINSYLAGEDGQFKFFEVVLKKV
jgi:large subunit ribosomal protein L15e